MSNADTRVESYFANLEAALHGPNKQSDAILAEVRADAAAEVAYALSKLPGAAENEGPWGFALAWARRHSRSGSAWRASSPRDSCCSAPNGGRAHWPRRGSRRRRRTGARRDVEGDGLGHGRHGRQRGRLRRRNG